MFSCEFVQVNSVPTFLRVNECFFRSAEQEIGLTMKCTVWIVAESSIRDIFLLNSARRTACIIYVSHTIRTQVVEEH